MDRSNEIIAVVMPDGSLAPLSVLDHPIAGAMLMVRHADGQMALEPIQPSAITPRGAHAVAARRRPIFDPESREVVGYELELAS